MRCSRATNAPKILFARGSNEISCPPKHPKSKKWLIQPISEPVKTVLEERAEVRQAHIPYVFFNPKTEDRWDGLDGSWWHILEEAGLRIRTDKQSVGIRERKNKKLIAKGLDPLPMPEQIQIKFDAVFHGLRHSFGSHLNDMNIPVATCSKLLGHSSIEMTEKYLASLRGVQEFKGGLDKLGALLAHHPEPAHEFAEDMMERDEMIVEEDWDEEG